MSTKLDKLIKELDIAEDRVFEIEQEIESEKLKEACKYGRWECGDEIYWTIETSDLSDNRLLQGRTGDVFFNAGNMFRDGKTAELFGKMRGARNRLELLAYEINGQTIAAPESARVLANIGGIFTTTPNISCFGNACFHTKQGAQQALELTTDSDLEIMFGKGERSE